MANPYNSDVAQANKAGGSGPSHKRGKATRGSLRMHCAAWPSPPGRTNAGWKPKHGRHAQVYPKSQGL